MRTSLNEIKAIEDHLLGHADTGSSLVFQANMILNAGLRDQVHSQHAAYKVVQVYGRKQIRAEIEAVHQALMDRPDNFMQKIIRLFKAR